MAGTKVDFTRTLHHHELRRPPLSRQRFAIERVEAGPSHARLSTHGRQCVPFAVHFTTDLEVVIRQDLAAVTAREAPRVEFLRAATGRAARAGRLQVLAFDAAVAAVAQGAVLLVVVLLAVRVVVDDVEVGGGEGLLAGFAGEAGLVPAAGQPSVCGLH